MVSNRTSFYTALAALVWCVLVFSFTGCKQNDAPQTKSTSPVVVDTVKAAPQSNVSQPVKPRSPASDDARQALLKRKGELMAKQKRIRASESLTPAQKDSALQVLEAESIEISRKLLAVP
ncbi:hypothetical protein EHM69_11125 [candidate division KSB1 bacterium]|nr:MAG: hypothetical protein EHM69_11125 [candidate division KSB1 bacterium]